jgi:dihydrodipicolinate synthase/N-acetylneuraminate lyase
MVRADESVPPRLRGAIAASVTPLTDRGASLDEPAFDPLVRFLAAGGVDGILVLGTTGEGILLSQQERQRAAEVFVAARSSAADSDRRPLAVAVHCGAQTTADTVALTRHAAEIGADAVAVIAPPYFPLDDDALLGHFRAAAAACAPLPFYVYEFAARSGYPIPVTVIEQLRDVAPNLVGLKVSDTPFDRVEPYFLEGLDVFVGSEPLVLEGLERGAVGAVSGLAAAFPEMISALVHERAPDAHRAVVDLRDAFGRLPFHAALKVVLATRGVPVREDVRGPLRGLSAAERAAALHAAGALPVRSGP